MNGDIEQLMLKAFEDGIDILISNHNALKKCWFEIVASKNKVSHTYHGPNLFLGVSAVLNGVQQHGK